MRGRIKQMGGAGKFSRLRGRHGCKAVETCERVSSEAAPSPKRFWRVGDVAKEDMLPAFVAEATSVE
jgi:hypothetical protein